MLWIFNGSVELTKPGMIPGLGWRSGQGEVIPESCCSREKRNACEHLFWRKELRICYVVRE